MRLAFYILGLIFVFISCSTNNPEIKSMDDSNLIIGTYTDKEGHVNGKAEGIYVAHFDEKKESLTIKHTIKDIKNPSYVIPHPSRNIIYAVQEKAGSPAQGRVKVYVHKDTEYEKVSDLTSHGNAPCHLYVDELASRLYVVNYGGGIINYKINDDGSLEKGPQIITYEGGTQGSVRQEAPHPHMVQRFGQFVYVTDLGTDEVMTFSVGNDGLLSQQSATATEYGGGPRHFDVNLDNAYFYVINELNLSVQAFALNNDGKPMNAFQTISLHNGVVDSSGHSGSAIKIHPSGQFLYAAMRAQNDSKDNTLQLFSIEKNGLLIHKDSFYSYGSVPRDFVISPTGKHLIVANQNSNNLVLFSINPSDGSLTLIDQNIKVKTPVSLKFY